MKTCPYCAEEIQDSAVVCRYCRSDVTAPPEETFDVQPRRSSSGSGFPVWAIVLIVGAVGMFLVIPCLIALLLPAVQQAREAARRTQCRNNLKQIGMALHMYNEVHNSFPPSYIPDENGAPMHSWRVLILPQLGEQALYERYDFSQPWDSPANRYVLDNMPAIYGCPSHPEFKGPRTNYAAVAGEDSIISTAGPVKVPGITDGLSNTLLVGEISEANILWTAPLDIDLTAHPVIGDAPGFSSYHPGGAMFVVGDGSVQFLAEETPAETLKGLATRNGGEVLRGF